MTKILDPHLNCVQQEDSKIPVSFLRQGVRQMGLRGICLIFLDELHDLVLDWILQGQMSIRSVRLKSDMLPITFGCSGFSFCRRLASRQANCHFLPCNSTSQCFFTQGLSFTQRNVSTESQGFLQKCSQLFGLNRLEKSMTSNSATCDFVFPGTIFKV